MTKRQIPVLIPFGDNEPYDLVIEINNVFYSVQVKTVRIQEDEVILVSMARRVGSNRLARESYKKLNIDFVIAYEISTNKIYLLNLSEFNNIDQIRLRTLPTKNNRKQGVH